VVQVATRVVFGTLVAVLAALALSLVSTQVNTVCVERHNGRDRKRRKVRQTCCFSKDWAVQEALTYLTMDSDNFCWPVRTLRVQVAEHQNVQRTPALVAGLTEHIGTINDWVRYPAVQRADPGWAGKRQARQDTTQSFPLRVTTPRPQVQ